jgi:hypothetical protein
MQRKWHGIVSNLRVMLNGTFVTPHVGAWRLTGVALYREISFKIAYIISVQRILWAQCEGVVHINRI